VAAIEDAEESERSHWNWKYMGVCVVGASKNGDDGNIRDLEGNLASSRPLGSL
jgi:hypothetical protein